MTTFISGPAAGQCLLLRRSPLLLRVVQNQAGKWDALDLLSDCPQPGETVFVYKAVSSEGAIHLRMSGGGSGWYERTVYEFVEPQPDQATLSSTKKWQDWATLFAGKLAKADHHVLPSE